MLSTCRAAALSRLLMPRFSSAATETLDPVQEALLQEQCILVDDNDNAIGQASKRECHLRDAKGDSPLHRAFSLFVFNEKNELLMQQRSMQKITFPGTSITH
jgi:isopentenyl-diphosphate delta-isomerase